MTIPHALDPSGNAVPLRVNANGELVVAGLAEMSNHLETIIAQLPAALSASGNLKVSIEEDNTAP